MKGGTKKKESADLFKFVADHSEGFVDDIESARDCDDPLGTRSVRDVDFGPRLLTDLLDLLASLPDYTAHFL